MEYKWMFKQPFKKLGDKKYYFHLCASKSIILARICWFLEKKVTIMVKVEFFRTFGNAFRY